MDNIKFPLTQQVSEPKKENLNESNKRDERVSSNVPHLSSRDPWRDIQVCTGQRPRVLHGLAFDHRRALCEMAQACNASQSRISKLKELIFLAGQNTVAEFNIQDQSGILVDDQFGSSVVQRATEKGVWVCRPVSVPESRPLEFELDDLQKIKAWPLEHTVKCLVLYHPKDEASLRAMQEQQIKALSDVVQQSKHDFLLEIVTPTGAQVDDTTFVQTLNRFYDLGIQPRWWKLPAQTSAAWQAIDHVITTRDPTCAGVVIMGHNAPIQELAKAFHEGAQFSCVKGYMVGRSVFSDPAQAWFQNKIDDTSCVQAISKNYAELVRIWQQIDRDLDLDIDIEPYL